MEDKLQQEIMDLFDHVKDNLRITWQTDEQEERHLKRMIEDSIYYFKGKTGDDLPLKQGLIRSLILQRVLYDWNHRLEWFEHNYQGEIIELTLEYASAKLAKQMQDAVEEGITVDDTFGDPPEEGEKL